MKNILIIVLLIILSSCEKSISKGFKKDVTLGLSTSWDGLNMKDAYLMDLETKTRLNTNEVALDKKIAIVVTGVDNLTEKDGKVMPSIDIQVADEANNVLYDGKDLLKSEYSKENASTLDATLTIGSPMESGKSYTMKARFYDKNGTGEIKSEILLKVK
jgi:hypothetical protein